MLTKVHIVKAMVFLVVVYGCKSWTIMEAERQRADAFELCYWRRYLRVLWTARKLVQSILKEINPEGLLGGLMMKLSSNTLAIWCEKPTHWKRLWCWERLREGREGSKRGWASWMASLTQWTQVWANSGRQWRTGKPGMLQSLGSKRVRHDWATEQQPQQPENEWDIVTTHKYQQPYSSAFYSTCFQYLLTLTSNGGSLPGLEHVQMWCWNVEISCQ